MLITRLNERIKATSPIVVGLDPRADQMPESLLAVEDREDASRVAKSFVAFNKEVIDGIYDIVPAVKPQLAFYEAWGIEGLKAYVETVKYAKEKGLIVIADAKRGDIGSTSKAYAEAFLGKKNLGMEADFLTVNPYLGTDGLSPFVDMCKENDRGIFILVKTSNPSSSEFQDRVSDQKKMYEYVAKIVEQYANEYKDLEGYSSIGSVVGATHPAELKALRQLMPSSLILVPGYGAQGGTAKDIMGAFDSEGLGAIINSSRGIIFAYKKYDCDVKEGARKAAIAMRDDIKQALAERG